MTQTNIINKLDELSYKGFKEAYLHQLEDTHYTNIGFEERLFALLDAQVLFLRNKRMIINHRLSKIKDKQAAIDAIDYNPERQLNKEKIHALASLNFIHAKQNIIITGKTGTGKSHIAQALANRAIIDGYKAYYVRTPSLLEEIRLSRIDGTYTNLLKKYSRFKLLILDAPQGHFLWSLWYCSHG